MNPNGTPVNGTRPLCYYGEQVEQPGTSSSKSMESSMPNLCTIADYDQEIIVDTYWKTTCNTENSALCNGPCQVGHCPQFQYLPSFPDDLTPYIDIDMVLSPAETELDHGSSLSMVSPVSRYSYPTMPSSPQHAEALSAIFEGANSSATVVNSGDCINVSNPKNSVPSAEPGKAGCSRTCTGCVRPASACHDAPRLAASEDEIRRQKLFFKGVSERKRARSGKWTCEIRISKKLREQCKLHDRAKANPRGKLWIGTFDTRCQAARALHVGRFLLSEKSKKNCSKVDVTNFEQNPETIRILSEFKKSMSEQTLDTKLLRRVRELATDYDG